MGLKVSEYEQLSSHTADVANSALAENTRTAMREALETISDLHDEETDLIFNEDGTVEVAGDEDEADEEE